MLGKHFEQPTRDEEEIKLREGLLSYVKGLRLGWTLINPPRKLEDIEKKLWPLGGEPVAFRYLDSVQGGEDINWLFEDLQEAVHDYMVRPYDRDPLLGG